MKDGDVIAIEPFATNGSGRISEAPINEIYGFSASRPVRLPAARALLKEISESYRTLPFARRWLKGERAEYALMQLLRSGAVHRYPVLWEVEGALVSQAEHTVVVLEKGCEVITRPAIPVRLNRPRLVSSESHRHLCSYHRQAWLPIWHQFRP